MVLKNQDIFLTKNEQVFEIVSIFLKTLSLQADYPKIARGSPREVRLERFALRGWFIFRKTGCFENVNTESNFEMSSNILELNKSYEYE